MLLILVEIQIGAPSSFLMRYIPEQTHLQTTLINKLKYIYMKGIEKIKTKQNSSRVACLSNTIMKAETMCNGTCSLRGS